MGKLELLIFVRNCLKFVLLLFYCCFIVVLLLFYCCFYCEAKREVGTSSVFRGLDVSSLLSAFSCLFLFLFFFFSHDTKQLLR